MNAPMCGRCGQAYPAPPVASAVPAAFPVPGFVPVPLAAEPPETHTARGENRLLAALLGVVLMIGIGIFVLMANLHQSSPGSGISILPGGGRGGSVFGTIDSQQMNSRLASA